MSFSSWLRPLPVSSNSGRRATRFRPGLEALEERSVPATFNVTTPLDVVDAGDGLLSLREADLAANASTGADTINVPAGTYVLSLGDLDIRDDLTVVGAGANASIVDANSLGRVFQNFGATVNIAGMAIRGGRAGRGAGIYNDGRLTLENCGLFNNQADSEGGGVYNSNKGTMTIRNSQFFTNQADINFWLNIPGAAGGGISNHGTLTISGSDIAFTGTNTIGGVIGGG